MLGDRYPIEPPEGERVDGLPDDRILPIPSRRFGSRRSRSGFGSKDVRREIEDLHKLGAGYQYVLLRNLDLQADIGLRERLETILP